MLGACFCTYGIGESLERCTCLHGFIVLLLDYLLQLIVLQSKWDYGLLFGYSLESLKGGNTHLAAS